MRWSNPIPGARQALFKLWGPCGPPFKIASSPGSYVHPYDAVPVRLCQVLAHYRRDQKRWHQPGWGTDASSAQQDAMCLWPSFFPAERTGRDFPGWNWTRPCWVTSPTSAWLWNQVKYQTLQSDPLTSSSTAESPWDGSSGKMCRCGMQCSDVLGIELIRNWGRRSASWGTVGSLLTAAMGMDDLPTTTCPRRAAWGLMVLHLRHLPRWVGAGPWHGTWAPTAHEEILQVPLNPLIRNHRLVWVGRNL